MSNFERLLVVKWGTSSTTNENGIDVARIGRYADQIADIRPVFKNIIVVASGSVAVGESVWREMHGDRPYPSKQTRAMLGTARAHMVWQNEFAKRGILAGQLLATHHQVDDCSSESILDATVQDCFENGVVPVGNENDAVSLEEMAKLSYGGENDGLASHIAARFGAEALIINTDTEGLMANHDSDPQLIRRVDFDDASALYARVAAGWVEGESEEFANDAVSKVDACLNATLKGVKSYIAKAGTDFRDILDNKAGTYFEESTWRT